MIDPDRERLCALVAEVHADDSEALVAQFASIFRNLPHATVEDLVQEAFARALDPSKGVIERMRSEGEFNHLGLLKWIRQTVRNGLCTYFRDETTRSRILEERGADVAAHSVSEAPAPDARTMGRQLAFAATEHIGRLSPSQRELFRLVELDGLSRSDTARKLGIGESQVKSRLERMRTRIATDLERRHAGKLCKEQRASIRALAAGEATSEQEHVAFLHMRGCSMCEQIYGELVRTTGAIAVALPVAPQLFEPSLAERLGMAGAKVKETVASIFSHGPDPVTLAQVGSSTRGLGAQTIALICAGAAAAGGGAYYAANGTVPKPLKELVEAGDDGSSSAKKQGTAPVRLVGSPAVPRLPAAPAAPPRPFTFIPPLPPTPFTFNPPLPPTPLTLVTPTVDARIYNPPQTPSVSQPPTANTSGSPSGTSPTYTSPTYTPPRTYTPPPQPYTPPPQPYTPPQPSSPTGVP